MKTTKEERSESLIDWQLVDYECTNFNHNVLKDFLELETRLAWAEALLERAKALLTYGWTPDGGADHEWLEDLEKGPDVS